MVGFAKRRATWRPPLQETGSILVVNEAQLRRALGAVAAGLEHGEVVIGADIVLSSPIDLALDYPVRVRGQGNARLLAKTQLDYAFGIEGGGPTKYLSLRECNVGDFSDVEDPPFLHLIRGLATDFRADVIDCVVQTATGLFDDDGSHTLRGARIRGNDFITVAAWELATAMIVQNCLVEGNTAYPEMNVTDAAAGGGFNRISGNDLGTSGGTIDTSAGSGFNVILGNTHSTINPDATDEVALNT